MEIINLLVGGLIIILGLLIKRFPDLLAGYNTMSKEEQKKVDINGLTSIIRGCLIVIGSIIIIGSLMSILFNINKVSIYLIPVSIVVFFPYLLIKAKKYNHNK
jgi:hypothetical protein